jgi:hypothetical protein
MRPGGNPSGRFLLESRESKGTSQRLGVDHMLNTIITSSLSRPEMIYVLAQIREEWQQAVGNRSLVSAETSVGLLLADVVKTVELMNQEQRTILGEKLFLEVATVLDAPNGIDH